MSWNFTIACSRLDWEATTGTCTDMFSVCCTSWSTANTATHHQQHVHSAAAAAASPGSRFVRKAKKSGRALLNAGPPPVQTPNVIHYYSPAAMSDALIPDFKVNSVDDDHNHQWHDMGGNSNLDSFDGSTCGVSKNANSRIMGGLDAGYGQFPWTAHIVSSTYGS